MSRGSAIRFSVQVDEEPIAVVAQVVLSRAGRSLVAVPPSLLPDVPLALTTDSGKEVGLTWVQSSCSKPAAIQKLSLKLTSGELDLIAAQHKNATFGEISESAAEEPEPTLTELLRTMHAASAAVAAQHKDMCARMSAVEAKTNDKRSKGKGTSSGSKPLDPALAALAPNLTGLGKKSKPTEELSFLGGGPSDEESESTATEEDGENIDLAKASPANMDRLIQLEMLKLLTEHKKKKKKSHSSGSDESGSESDDLKSGKGQSSKVGLIGIKYLKRRFRRHPKRITKEYVKMIQEALGIDGTALPWRTRDLNKKLLRIFGRLKGLHRCHGMLSEIFQMQLQGHHDHATAYTAQALKCLHQVAIDGGSWLAAEHFLPIGEALDSTAQAGAEEEMIAIHGALKAKKELAAMHKTLQTGTDDGERPDKPDKPGKGGKKGKTQAEDDA